MNFPAWYVWHSDQKYLAKLKFLDPWDFKLLFWRSQLWLWQCTVNMLFLTTEGNNVQIFACCTLKMYWCGFKYQGLLTFVCLLDCFRCISVTGNTIQTFLNPATEKLSQSYLVPWHCQTIWMVVWDFKGWWVEEGVSPHLLSSFIPFFQPLWGQFPSFRNFSPSWRL